MNRWVIDVCRWGTWLAVLLAGVPWRTAHAQLDEVLQAEQKRVEVIAQASQTFVAIFSPGGQGGGSGVVISPDGFALSNYHVTSGAGDAMKCGMADGQLYDAVIVGLDPTGDVALIKLLGRNDFPHAPLANSDAVRAGDWVFAAGNPFLLANDFQPTISYGIVSGVHRYQYPAGTLLEYADCIQCDAAINPGNSGGPLFNAQGEVIGINGRGSFEKRGRVNVGVGYAISINQIKKFLGSMKGGRIVDHATLGATVASSADGKVLVSDILEESDAWRRGLRYGDEIVSFGGRSIRTANAFKNVLGIYPKSARVDLTFRRKGKLVDTSVRLAGVHRSGELEELVQGKGDPAEKQPDPNDPEKNPPPQPDPEKKPPEKGPPQPRPMPVQNLHAARPMPEIVKQHYEKRAGYANYYFNRIAQERIWKQVQTQGDFSTVQEFALRGKLATGGDFQLAVGDNKVSLRTPGGELNWIAGDDLAAHLDPAGSGGLMAAVHLWKRFLKLGIERFGQISYDGTFSLPGSDELLDVLVGVHGGVECRMYIEPQSGRLRLLELIADNELDPCELYFGDYREADGRQVPGQIVVRCGDAIWSEFVVEEFVGSSPSGG